MSMSSLPGSALHGASYPSDWVLRWAQAWRDRDGVTALDLACGSGRHLRLLAGEGVAVTGVDRDAAALATLTTLAGLSDRLELIEADIEQGPWPLADRVFDVVLVTNYLWRPLLPRVVEAVAPGGWLIYETFTDGQQTVGRPANPDFLLTPGELLTAAAGLRVIAYEDGFIEAEPSNAGGGAVNGRYVQRVAAVRGNRPADATPPGVYPRYRLR
ncbi:class I SAM-dependent methyltransferase [Mitsuaria sp. CC2]|uniref:class I SAM-dependent methyltransferase n=1 Tax=Mitsuaria sp. CC2 TaxID=3029186 RepID=UPI003B8C9115